MTDVLHSLTLLANVGVMTAGVLFVLLWLRFPTWRSTHAGLSVLVLTLAVLVIALVGLVRRAGADRLAELLALPAWSTVAVVLVWRTAEMLSGKNR